MDPLLISGQEAVRRDCAAFVLVMHDWSHVHYPDHTSKKDRIGLGNSSDLGYEMQSSLLVSDRSGQPLAPISISLQAAEGVHCSRSWTVRAARSPLDELQPVMDFVAQRRLAKPAVHIVDAESDSVAHYRSWSAAGHSFLVRADDRLVQHEGQMRRLSEIRESLWQRHAFGRAREVTCRGKQGQQWVAETMVTLTRPATPQRRDGQPRRKIPGKPLPLRLVISVIRGPDDKKDLAVWYLLTNVPEQVEAAQIALWYYWRWDIESYFKLLKSAGQQLEHWQQETATAVIRRLLVASMACVVVWQLARQATPEARQLRDLLIRLSGRQMRRDKDFTMPALLAGMWVLLSMLSLLEQHDVEHLRRLAQLVLVLCQTLILG